MDDVVAGYEVAPGTDGTAGSNWLAAALEDVSVDAVKNGCYAFYLDLFLGFRPVGTGGWQVCRSRVWVWFRYRNAFYGMNRQKPVCNLYFMISKIQGVNPS